jgi:hypothetical protein
MVEVYSREFCNTDLKRAQSNLLGCQDPWISGVAQPHIIIKITGLMMS